MISNKERIKELLFREALCSGRVRPCETCNDYCLVDNAAIGTSGVVCRRCLP